MSCVLATKAKPKCKRKEKKKGIKNEQPGSHYVLAFSRLYHSTNDKRILTICNSRWPSFGVQLFAEAKAGLEAANERIANSCVLSGSFSVSSSP